MTTYINYNGTIQNASEPVFFINNRAFRYGDGLFETMRMMKGEIRFLELHARRLQAGMKFLKFDAAGIMSAERIRQEVFALAKANQIFSNARIRLTVFRDAYGLYTPSSNHFAFVIEMQGTDEQDYELNKKGLLIDVFKEVYLESTPLSPHKTISSLPYVLAGIYKKEHSLDECVLLNKNGYISEAISSNIFIVKDKQLFTPELGEGCVDGVMRKVLVKMAAQLGVPVHETVLAPESLRAADEIFMTNAVKGIQWVVGYKEKRYFSRMASYLNEQLNVLAAQMQEN